jgi:protein-S-isoprenylcysteine O-methyltransferase Ste14
MRYYLITLVVIFYIFFFTRAFVLSKSLKKNIKANNFLVNNSIISAGITSILFIAYLSIPQIGEYLIIYYSSDLLTIIGSCLITVGLLTSSIASLTLKKSWRIGVDDKEKTELITNGIYKISRNPYFLSYDVVLIGMICCLLSPFVVIVALITMVLFHLMILKEEVYLEDKHQDNYRNYKKAVRRYI